MTDNLPPLNSSLSKLKRKHVIRKTSSSNLISTESLQKIHDESNRRLSQENDGYFERLRRATIRNDKNEELYSGRAVLDKIRQNSSSVKRVDMSQASRTVAKQLTTAVSEAELLREALNSVVHRMGQGNTHFENKDLNAYIGTAFRKPDSEISNIVKTLEEEHTSEHTLSIELESADLKSKIKHSVFCSMTVSKKNKFDAFSFTMCTDKNTRISTICSSEHPLWDEKLTIPLETSRGHVLIVAVWKAKKNPTLALLHEDKKCVGFTEIDLNAQPTTGSHESWTLLSKNGKEKGKIQIGLKYKLSMGMKQNAVMVQAGLLSKFISVDVPKSGRISAIAGHILELQKIQQNISVDEARYSEWLVRSKLCLKTNTQFERLHAELQQLLTCVNNTDCKLSDTHRAHLFTTFSDFQSTFVGKMEELNSVFPYIHESALVELKYLAKCYEAIIECREYASRHAGVIAAFKQELDSAFKVNVSKVIKRLIHHVVEGGDVLEMTKAVKEATKEVRIELQNENKCYVPSLQMTSFTDILLHEINEEISKQTKDAVSEISSYLRSTPPDSLQQEELLNGSLALYVEGSDLKKLCQEMSGPGTEHPISQHFHHWFHNIIENWLAMVQNKQRSRVQKAVQLDPLERTDMHITYSSSLIDVATMNEHLSETQMIFDFPDEPTRFAVIFKLNRVICDSTVQVSELLVQRGEELFSKRLRKTGAMPEMELVKKAMVILCSVNEAIAHLHKIPIMLMWDQFKTISLLEKLQTKIDKAKNDIAGLKAKWMMHICSLVIEPKFVASFKQYIEHLYKGNKDGIEEVIDLLADELNKLVMEIDRHLFVELLRCVWERVILPRFEQHTSTKPQKVQSYYDILQAGFQDLSNWFTAEAEELTEVITKSRSYQKQVFKLQNLTISLEELFFRYYVEEMLQEEEQINRLGTIKFSVCLISSVQNKSIVRVRVLECENLPQMDTLTHCDAQVRVVLQPRHTTIFKHLKVQKTKTVSNDVNPVFNEQLEFTLRVEESDLKDGSCLQLSVWDKDKFSADDFVGECLIPFKDIPADSPQTYTKHLALPDLNSFCFDVLNHRTPYESLAKKFVNERKSMVNQVGDEFTSSRVSGSEIFQKFASRISRALSDADVNY